MSRVAKLPIQVPKGVEVQLKEKLVNVKGPKGDMSLEVHGDVSVKMDDGIVNVAPITPCKKSWSLAGTFRSLINNLVVGVTEGFQKTLELVGVGYRVQVQGSALNLSLGYSHPIKYELPKGVSAEAPNNTTIILRSSDKQLLGQTAAEIRSLREPEPYKGKGVKYSDETIVRKETKKK